MRVRLCIKLKKVRVIKRGASIIEPAFKSSIGTPATNKSNDPYSSLRYSQSETI